MNTPPKFINKLYNYLINDNYEGFSKYYLANKRLMIKYHDTLISTAFKYPIKDKKIDLDRYAYFLSDIKPTIQLVSYFMATHQSDTAWKYFNQLTANLKSYSANTKQVMLQAIISNEDTLMFQKFIDYKILPLNDLLAVALKSGMEKPEILFKNINFSEDNKLFILALLCQEKNESIDNKIDYEKYYKILYFSMNSSLEDILINYCQNPLSKSLYSSAKLFSIVKAMGRDDDLLIINWMIGGKSEDIKWVNYIYSPYREILPVLDSYKEEAKKIMFNFKLTTELAQNNKKIKHDKL